MKDIKGYEGLYAVTSCGKVWSYRSQKFLAPAKHKHGYLQVILYKNGTTKNFLVHRLVAETYLPNPTGLPQVNHKDECKEHNYLNNLEWCDAKYNHDYGTRTKRTCKPVFCIELDKTYDSAAAAARELGLDQSVITKVCKGNRKTHGGYHWQYI